MFTLFFVEKHKKQGFLPCFLVCVKFLCSIDAILDSFRLELPKSFFSIFVLFVRIVIYRPCLLSPKSKTLFSAPCPKGVQ